MSATLEPAVKSRPVGEHVAAGARVASSRLWAWRAWLRVPEPIRPYWNRVARFIGSIIGWIPLTLFGAVAFYSIYWIKTAYAGSQPDLIVLTLAFGGMVICAIDIIVVLGAALWLKFRREEPPPEEPLELDLGTPTRTGYEIGLLSFAPLLHFEITWVEPMSVDSTLNDSRRGAYETVRPRERGVADKLVRRIRVSDWFGLSRISFLKRTNRLVKCLPWCGRSSHFDLIEQFRPGDTFGHPEGQPIGDLVEMRRYVAGDPLKLVLWKAYARTGKMLVRTPERSVSPTDRMLAYLVAAPGDEPAAGLVRAALEGGLLGNEVIFMADGAVKPSEILADRIEQIIRSVNFRAEGGAGLDKFLVQGEANSTSAAFLFVSPRPGPWLDRVCHTLAGHRGPFEAIIGVDGVREGKRSRWQKWLLSTPEDGLACPDGLREVRDRLQAKGAAVRIVNRTTGETVALDVGRYK